MACLRASPISGRGGKILLGPGTLTIDGIEIRVTGFSPEIQREQFAEKVHTEKVSVLTLHTYGASIQMTIEDISRDWAMKTVFPEATFEEM